MWQTQAQSFLKCYRVSLLSGLRFTTFMAKFGGMSWPLQELSASCDASAGTVLAALQQPLNLIISPNGSGTDFCWKQIEHFRTSQDMWTTYRYYSVTKGQAPPTMLQASAATRLTEGHCPEAQAVAVLINSWCVHEHLHFYVQSTEREREREPFSILDFIFIWHTILRISFALMSSFWFTLARGNSSCCTMDS